MSKIGFIGVGNMGGALARAVCRTVDAQSVYLADFMPEKALTLSKELGCVVADNTAVLENCSYVFLGVKPQVLPALLQEIAACETRNPQTVFISMAAGVQLHTIEQVLGRVPLIRIMPNTPVAVGEGMVLYAVNQAVTEKEQAAFLRFMQQAGTLDKLPESLIDAGCAISGCGPAFVYSFIEALADAGENCGLSLEKAQQYAAQTVLGAARLLLESGESPAKLRDAVCSPAGSTIEGVHALQKGGFADVTAAAVQASFERTKQLGKQ